MSLDPRAIYELLPAISRIRDQEQGEPLRQLISVIAEQVAVLQENLDQLYDDQFVETCADWVVPYLADLLGVRNLSGAAPQQRSQRALVANTVAYRRRKGTAAVLEQLARDVTGWEARVVEFFALLGTAQHLNHLRPHNRVTVGLRGWETLCRLNTPLDTLAHTLEVRRVASQRGRYNVPNVGIFLWRIGSHPLTCSPAVGLKDDLHYLVSPLAVEQQLYSHPETEVELTHLAERTNLPMPIGRREMAERLSEFYGRGKSLCLYRGRRPVPVKRIRVCDLSDANATGGWAHMPPAQAGPTVFCVDPVLGRIALSKAVPARTPLRVSFHYGFSAELGGGEYDRLGTFGIPGHPVPASADLAELQAIHEGAIEIADSGRYQCASKTITAQADARLELRAADRRRPTVMVSAKGDKGLVITGGTSSEVTLNGLVICGAIKVPADSKLGVLRLRHCTLVPGRNLTRQGEPARPGRPSLVVKAEGMRIEIDRCIVGAVQVAPGCRVHVTDSIVDATDEQMAAYGAPVGKGDFGGTLCVENSTIIGTVAAERLELASNVIFTSPVRCRQRQRGCVRFSYVPPGSRVPRRYRCQPVADERMILIRPTFTSSRYHHPGYCQLARTCAVEIRRGGEGESEMGAFHHLHQPQREAALRARLDEYLRFGLEAGLFYAT